MYRLAFMGGEGSGRLVKKCIITTSNHSLVDQSFWQFPAQAGFQNVQDVGRKLQYCTAERGEIQCWGSGRIFPDPDPS
jgi:hypothetical protein